MIHQIGLLALLQVTAPVFEATPPPSAEYSVDFGCNDAFYSFSYVRSAALRIGHIRMGPAADRLRDVGDQGREELEHALAKAQAVERVYPYCADHAGGVRVQLKPSEPSWLSLSITSEGVGVLAN